MSRGSWRNWDGRDGAESYPGQRVPTRPAECLWCGHHWATRVHSHPVCPKCNMTNDLTRKVLSNPSLEKDLLHKTRVMKNKFK
jgi:hypothetical protein